MKLSVSMALVLLAVLGSPGAQAQCTCETDIGGMSGSCVPDGDCNVNDIIHVFICMDGANACGEAACDINCDGAIDLLDASYPWCCFKGICTDCELPAPVGACCYQNLAGGGTERVLAGHAIVLRISHRRGHLHGRRDVL